MPEPRSTLGWPHFRRPPFDPKAAFLTARDLLWGSNAEGYVRIPMGTPVELADLKPVCDPTTAAKLYRTGFIGMFLNEDGSPKLRDDVAAADVVPSAAAAPTKLASPVAITGAVCPTCGKQFKGKHVPFFHSRTCQ